jgi:Family of unknown function (DUF5946)
MGDQQMNLQEQYHELAFYTLEHKGGNFIHQHVVDAFAAQTADEHTKPITLVYGLAGLYLLIEKKYNGKEVQQAHVQMSKGSKVFPVINLPVERGRITIATILDAAAGAERDALIYDWCKCVWEAYKAEHEKIIAVTKQLLNP